MPRASGRGPALFRLLLFWLWCAVGAAAPVLAQPLPPADSASAAAPVVEAVRFAGNDAFSDGALSRRVRTRANRRLLGLPGLTWWRGLYRFGDFLGGRIGTALKKSGEPPATLDLATLADDAERLRLFYRQEGFREASVATRVDTVAARRAGDPARVEVVFQIDPGPPLYADSVRYDGLSALSEEQQRRLVRGSLFDAQRLDAGAPLGFEAEEGQRYSETLLLEERQRLLRFLHDEGYAAATRDSVRALVFPKAAAPPADSFDVTFRVRPGPRYRVGDVHFSVTGLEDDAPTRLDTITQGSGGLVTARIDEERQLSPALLRRALQTAPGAWYDESRLRATKRRLEATGVFSFTDIEARFGQTARADSVSAPRLPLDLTLRTRRRHRIRLETFALQRSGALASELGTGVGATYENVNLLGGGETFRARAAGSIAADFGAGPDTLGTSALFSSAQAEVSASLTYPYLIRPFGWIDGVFRLYTVRTQLSLSLLTARRENLRFLIRGRGDARLRLEMQHSPTTSSLVDVINLSLSNPDTLAGFQVFLDDLIGPASDPIVTDPVQRARIQEDYTQPQINTAIGYTFRAARVNPIRRADGFSYEAGFEIGNTLPYLFDRLVLSPDTVENSLPGLPLLRGRSANRLIYRPYLRLMSDLRRYWPISREDVLAAKLVAGVAHPTGRPDVVPFDRRFYAGGSSSVRGWDLRELRPVPDTSGLVVPNLLGGDVKLEASLELRNTVVQNLLGAGWILALFADAGNVWLGPRNPGGPAGRFRFDQFYKELGVGAGFGLRLAWDYLILRLDAAYKVHDPLRPGGGLFPDGLSAPRLHFGIGHAF